MYNKIIFVMSLLLGSHMMTALPIDNTKGGTMHNYKHDYYKTINTQELIELKKNTSNLIIVDSRTKQYDDGKRIQDAVYLPADAGDAEIRTVLPQKNQPTIVYCWSSACPASTFLVDRLAQMGYSNLYKYPEGLVAWIEQGLPIDTVTQD